MSWGQRLALLSNVSLAGLSLVALSCAGSTSEAPGSASRAGPDGSVLPFDAVDTQAQAAAAAARVNELGAYVSANFQGPRYLVPYSDADLSQGAEWGDALVTIVLFLDYQCPYSARLDQELGRLLERYPTAVRLVIKHLPLTIHAQAEPAARAALAAHAQGRGWAMHEQLFANQKALGGDMLEFAKLAQVPDLRRFQADMADPDTAATVERDLALAAQLGIRSTPSFFINGDMQRGAKSLEQLEALVLAEREQVDGLLAAGARRDEVYGAIMLSAQAQRDMLPAPTAKFDVTPRGRPAADQSYAVPLDGRPTRGPADALVTIVEFADFECPYSAKVQATLTELQARFGKDLRLVYRHQPLPMHGRAEEAARAAIAADRQGQFWAMHDALFALGKDIGTANFVDLAAQLGLDPVRFRADLNDHAGAALVREDQAIAQRFGASGTPAFFINGRPLSGAQPVESFIALINEELGKAKAYQAKHKLERKGDALYAHMAQNWRTEVEAPDIADRQRRQLSTKGLAGKGKLSKPALTVVACADFDCPYSARGAQTINDLFALAPYKDQLAYYFVSFPLPMHKDAMLAHQAAVAANNQGQFWPMHDLLFADRSKRGEADLIGLAAQLGLDVKRFKADLHSKATLAQVNAEKQLCASNGVSGTPGYFVNGRKVNGAVPITQFVAVFDEELAGGFEAKANN